MSNEDKTEGCREWAVASINNLIASDGLFVDGDWIESKDQDPYGDIRLIQLADIGDGVFRNKSQRFLTKTTATRLNCTFLEYHDILVARIPEPLGRACLFPFNKKYSYVTAVDVAIIRPGNVSVDAAFLMHAINYQETRNKISKLQSGTTRKRISRSNLATIDISFPPLPEQRRIVAKIEELFSELDKSVELLKTLQQQVKVYRQAVLKAAFEGKFTNDNSPWQTISLKDIGVWTGGGTPSKNNNDYWDNGTILWVSPKDMKCKVIDDTMNKITTEGLINSSAKLISKGSILFVVRSGILRRTIPIAIAEEDLTTNQDIQSVTPNGGIQSEYIFWYCKAHEEDIREKCTKDGTTVDSIETSLLKRYPVKVCSFSNQKQIVQEIESRLSVADKCEDTINQAMQQAESLRQSILKKAFEGRLLSESELEEIRQEPDWEPASVLLERIKAQKSAPDVSKPPAKQSSRKGKKHS